MSETEKILEKIWSENPTMNYEELIQLFDDFKKGSGFLGRFVNVNYNDISKKTLERYGDKRILALNVYRTPLSGLSMALLNIGTLGAYGRAKEELNYDKLFHLALVATVDDNGTYKNVILEKDPKISISTYYPTNKDTEVHPVNLHGKTFTINDMTETLRKQLGDQQYFSYSAFEGRNCQNYVLGLLNSMGLLNETLKDFIYQDLTQLIKKLPSYTPSVSNAVTNLGAISHQIMGKGLDNVNLNGSKFLMSNY